MSWKKALVIRKRVNLHYIINGQRLKLDFQKQTPVLKSGNFIKKETTTQVFSSKFVEFLITILKNICGQLLLDFHSGRAYSCQEYRVSFLLLALFRFSFYIKLFFVILYGKSVYKVDDSVINMAWNISSKMNLVLVFCYWSELSVPYKIFIKSKQPFTEFR